MRILTAVHRLWPGGMERVACLYSRAYAQQGHASAVLAYDGSGPREDELREAGLQVWSGEEGHGEREAAVAEALAWSPDVIHIHRPGHADQRGTGYLLREAAARMPASLRIETNVFGKPDPSPDASLIDVHLHVSRWSLWKWRQWTSGRQPRPVGVFIPNPVEDAAFTPMPDAEKALLRQADEIPVEAVVVGCYAQPDPVKWPPLLLDAFASVARRDARVHLRVAGLTDEARQRIDALPADLRARVHVRPFISGDGALRQAYSLLDVFAHASRMGESFGLVLAEALLCGIPALSIAIPHRGNSQIEVIGPGGIVAGNPRTYTHALSRLCASPSLRQSYGIAGRRHVLEEYRADHVVRETLRMIDVVRSHPPLRREAALREAHFVTDVSDGERLDLARRAQGASPRWMDLARLLLHQPLSYRLWSAVRFGR